MLSPFALDLSIVSDPSCFFGVEFVIFFVLGYSFSNLEESLAFFVFDFLSPFGISLIL